MTWASCFSPLPVVKFVWFQREVQQYSLFCGPPGWALHIICQLPWTIWGLLSYLFLRIRTKGLPLVSWRMLHREEMENLLCLAALAGGFFTISAPWEAIEDKWSIWSKNQQEGVIWNECANPGKIFQQWWSPDPLAMKQTQNGQNSPSLHPFSICWWEV